jgi:hypothetical protein
MSFRTELLKTVVKIREIPGPTGLDILTTRVIVRTRTWSGGEVKLGTPSDVEIELFPRPRVRDAGGGGTTVTIGPITPQNADGGYTPIQLNPEESDGVESYYILIGPDGEERAYKLIEINDKRAFSYTLTLQALERRTPF